MHLYSIIHPQIIYETHGSMGLNNLIMVVFNQPHVLTTLIEKETIQKKKKTQLICFGLVRFDWFKKCHTLYISIYYYYKCMTMEFGA